MQERNARKIEVTDRPAQNGDTVNIDFVGTVDGVKFDGGEAEGFDLTLGSGQFIPGFEDQVIGMNIGEDRDINVKFPEDYFSKDLAGKDADLVLANDPDADRIGAHVKDAKTGEYILLPKDSKNSSNISLGFLPVLFNLSSDMSFTDLIEAIVLIFASISFSENLG